MGLALAADKEADELVAGRDGEGRAGGRDRRRRRAARALGFGLLISIAAVLV
jgi:hypothetical protein